MYQTLYRKYRPRSFSEIVGQDIIVRTLKNSILNCKVAHAYLFIGPRGTGKTSTAKIFARAVNCLDNHEGDICANCIACDFSMHKDCLDIIEIDAASNNGVDEIRNLREKVALVPSELKYKVYIIDEVHMLTISAFNALLKTLEEPPEHVIFILATTDPQKVPETIISRCQCFNFSRIADLNIVNYLSMVCQKEKIDCEADVLEHIAVMSDGGMRDSISMLDKLSSYKNGKIVLEDFLTLNGLVTTKDLDNFLNLILESKVSLIIEMLENWNSKGKNIVQIMIQFLDFLKSELIEGYINNTVTNLSLLQELANLLNEKMFDIKKSSNPKIYIEIMLLNFVNQCKIISREIISSKTSKIDELNCDIIQNKHDSQEKSESFKNADHVSCDENSISEVKEKKSVIMENCSSKFSHSNINDIMEIRMNNAFISAKKEFLKEDKLKFNQLNDYTFDQNIGYLVCALLDGKIRLSSENYLVVSYEYDSVVLENLVNFQNMEKVLFDKLGMTKKLIIISDDKWSVYAKQYVDHLKNNEQYEYREEPELMFDYGVSQGEENLNNENNDSVSSIFGDIVEMC